MSRNMRPITVKMTRTVHTIAGVLVRGEVYSGTLRWTTEPEHGAFVADLRHDLSTTVDLIEVGTSYSWDYGGHGWEPKRTRRWRELSPLEMLALEAEDRA